MKRSEINLTNADLIHEVGDEISRRLTVLARSLEFESISQYEANKKMLAMVELKEFIELLDEKGMTFFELKRILKESKSVMAVQKKMIF